MRCGNSKDMAWLYSKIQKSRKHSEGERSQVILALYTKTNIVILRQNFIANKMAIFLQKNLRIYITRIALSRLNRAAIFIQGHFRTKWLNRTFVEMRQATRVIQVLLFLWIGLDFKLNI